MENFGSKKKDSFARRETVTIDSEDRNQELHPAWQELIRFCRDLGYGEIERLNIQDGLPVSAEVIKKKIRWC